MTSNSQRSPHLFLPSAGIQGMCHHCPTNIVFFLSKWWRWIHARASSLHVQLPLILLIFCFSIISPNLLKRVTSLTHKQRGPYSLDFILFIKKGNTEIFFYLKTCSYHTVLDPCTHRDLPTSVSWVIGLKVCTTTPGSRLSFQIPVFIRFLYTN